MRYLVAFMLLWSAFSSQAQADALRDLCLRLLAEEPAASTTKGGIIAIYYQDSSYFIPFPTGKPTQADDLFEIGSVSKLYTMALLDSLVRAGRLNYSDSLSQQLKGSLLDATLGDLAAHRSGLALFPSNMGPYASEAGRLQDYPTEALYRFLEQQELKGQGAYQHSHIGYELLRFVIEREGQGSYAELLKQWILEPQGLERTFVQLPDSLSLVSGYNHAGHEVPHAAYRYFQGALGLRSSARDLLTFVQQQLKLPWSAACYEVQANPAKRRLKFEGGYGWQWFWPRRRYHRVFLSSGMTTGHRAYALMVPEANIAVVVLSRQVADIHDVPLRILEHLSYGWKK